MLFRLVDQISSRISALDEQRDAPEMFRQICVARPDFESSFAEVVNKGVFQKTFGIGTDQVRTMLRNEVGQRHVRLVKELPNIAGEMVRECRRRGAEPRVRCAVAGALAYFVQPHDIIPDDAPGGYGFVDDSILLRVALREFMNLVPESASQAEREGKYIEAYGRVIAEHLLPAMEMAVQAMSTTFGMLMMLAPEAASFSAEQIIASPLQMSAPQPPPAFRHPRPAPSVDRGHWSGGNYFEGNDVIMGSGPSLIGGQLFIPNA